VVDLVIVRRDGSVVHEGALAERFVLEHADRIAKCAEPRDPHCCNSVELGRPQSAFFVFESDGTFRAGQSSAVAGWSYYRPGRVMVIIDERAEALVTGASA
jgi:hypothetical protein